MKVRVDRVHPRLKNNCEGYEQSVTFLYDIEELGKLSGQPAGVAVKSSVVHKERKGNIMFGYIDDRLCPVETHSSVYAMIHLLYKIPELHKFVVTRVSNMVKYFLSQIIDV